MCRSISSIRPRSSSCRPTSPADPRRSSRPPRRARSARLLDRATEDGDAVEQAGILRVVREYRRSGPAMRQPSEQASLMALSKPSPQARTAPVVRVYSSIRPGLTATPVSQSMSLVQAAVTVQRHRGVPKRLAAAVCGSVSSILASCLLVAVCQWVGRRRTSDGRLQPVRTGGRGWSRKRGRGVPDRRRGRGVRGQLEPAGARGVMFGNRRYFQGATPRLRGENRLQHPGRPAQAAGEHGLLTPRGCGAGAPGGLRPDQERPIQLVPVFAQLGEWGLRHRPTTERLRVRAEGLQRAARRCGPNSWPSCGPSTWDRERQNGPVPASSNSSPRHTPLQAEAVDASPRSAERTRRGMGILRCRARPGYGTASEHAQRGQFGASDHRKRIANRNRSLARQALSATAGINGLAGAPCSIRRRNACRCSQSRPPRARGGSRHVASGNRRWTSTPRSLTISSSRAWSSSAARSKAAATRTSLCSPSEPPARTRPPVQVQHRSLGRQPSAADQEAFGLGPYGLMDDSAERTKLVCS